MSRNSAAPTTKQSIVPDGSAAGTWTDHWSEVRQEGLVQRFFSLYRKQVFARTVAYFIDRCFPPAGTFVEAGSGTSETSGRIDTRGGARRFVAVDFVPSVLKRSDPIVQHRLCADLFHLPLQDATIDGLWNVGVMEHFTAEQISAAMDEFRRVLRHGAPLMLLWPGVASLPQKVLRTVETLIHRWQDDATFRFHPPEISPLRSGDAARDLLDRHGFRPVALDAGARSLFAFITIVGVKR